MTKRLALTPAVGLFAGLSVVSYGAVSMMLTGVHGTRPASASTCTSSATASPTTKALIRPAAHAAARAQHPAGMPVLLAYAAHLSRHDGTQAPAGGGSAAAQGAAGSAAASQTQAVSQSTAPLPSTQPSPSASPPPLPQPSPGSSAGPQPGGLPQPGPAQSTKSKQLTPGGTLKSPISTPTATPTSTATPTTTPTTPPPGTLCMTVQTLNNRSAVDPGTKIGYAIEVWLAGSTDGSAKITLSAKPSSVSPTFSVCVPSGKSKCTVSLTAGKKFEVEAELAAPDRPTKRVVLTATATSSQASNSATASATVDIKPKNPSPSSSPTPNAGDGGTLPPAAGLPSGTTIPGLGVQPSGDLGSAFPQVSPSPSASAGAASPQGHTTKTIDLSAGLPLTVRLIGGQVIGLAVLAAAVTIAVARLSLRRQPAKHGEDNAGS
jgi:hypothetical protein